MAGCTALGVHMYWAYLVAMVRRGSPAGKVAHRGHAHVGDEPVGKGRAGHTQLVYQAFQAPWLREAAMEHPQRCHVAARWLVDTNGYGNSSLAVEYVRSFSPVCGVPSRFGDGGDDNDCSRGDLPNC